MLTLRAASERVMALAIACWHPAWHCAVGVVAGSHGGGGGDGEGGGGGGSGKPGRGSAKLAETLVNDDALAVAAITKAQLGWKGGGGDGLGGG